jgi:hypothetical protein
MDIGELDIRIPTVSEINGQIVDFVKEYVKQKVSEVLSAVASDENLPRDKLMAYVRDIQFDDILSTLNSVKKPRKRVESRERCRAKTCKGDRCTRKRKDDMEYCGSHESSRPYGVVEDEHPVVRSKPVIKAKASAAASSSSLDCDA